MSTDSLDLDRLESVIPIARNNHTEVVITPDELEALLTAARERDAVVEAVRGRARIEIADAEAGQRMHAEMDYGPGMHAEAAREQAWRDVLRTVDSATRDRGAE